MDMYLYRLMNFDAWSDNANPCAQIVETRLTSVLQLSYGYYSIGLNCIDIYPYHTATLPSRPTMIFCGKEQESPEPYSLLFPYQNKSLAREVFSGWLAACGYERTAKIVKKNAVTHLRRLSFAISKEDVWYVKRLDKKKTLARNNDLYRLANEEKTELL